MCRLALGQGLLPRSFYVNALRWNDVWRRDLDGFDDADKLEFLARKTDKPLASLTGMTFGYDMLTVGYPGYLECQESTHFCPLCLKEDRAPYFRKIWRSPHLASCERHGIFLHARCSTCHSPIKLLSRDDLVDLSQCGQCETPLYDDIRTVTAPKFLQDYSRKITTLFNGGWFELDEEDYIHHRLFFEGLSVLTEIVCMHEVWIRVYDHAHLKEYFGKPFSIHYHQQESFIDRCVFLLVLSWMLVDWPNNFRWATSELPTNAVNYLAKKCNLPFWLWSVTKECFDIPNEEYRSLEEIRSLAKLISTGTIGERDFRRAFGRRYPLRINGRSLTKFRNIYHEAIKLHACSND
jgi:hypothetical protein